PLTESPTHATSPLALIAQKPNHHYAMNETGGTTAFDSGSGGVNATITTSGSVTKNQPGRYGRSLSFSGTGRLTPSSAITLPSQWTVTSWIKVPLPAAAGARSIVNGPSLHHALFIGITGNEYGAWIS